MIEETLGEGPYSVISDACPKPITFPAACMAAKGAVESVCWSITSAPCSINVFAASDSFAGSIQVKSQMILNSTFGLTFFAWI